MIVGINPSHDSCFCLLDEYGRPLYILEEERFNRVKHASYSTTLSLQYLINNGKLDPAQVTDLVYGFEIEPEKLNELYDKCYQNVEIAFGRDILRALDPYWHSPALGFSLLNGLGLKRGYTEVVEDVRNLFPHAREVGYMHHACHAASAFWPSPFEESVILIVDGSGKLETTSIWHGEGNDLYLLDRIDLPHSIGILYWLFSNYISLEEGQTMGLAAYGQPIYAEKIIEYFLHLHDDGTFSFAQPLVFWFDMDNAYATEQIEKFFGVKARWKKRTALTQFHANIAASLQVVTEKLLIRLAKRAQQLTGSKNLCLAGGVIQNCVANGRLLRENLFSSIWIQPMATDAGAALGAALYHHKRTQTKKIRWRMKSAQLGVGYDETEIIRSLEMVNIPFHTDPNPASQAAQWLSDGRVVAWFQGRAEVGPRALGGRSLLAAPQNAFNYFRVNQIKQRQAWRPLAPSILSNAVAEYVKSSTDSPYMILSFTISKTQRQVIPASCHFDGSARVQTVSEEYNVVYTQLLERLNELTNVPIVLNTSLNMKTEPIVQYPLEAVRDFLISEIDHLILDHCVISEKPNLHETVLQALSRCNYVALYAQYFGGQTVYILQSGQPTSRQSRQIQDLQAVLSWLGIPSQICTQLTESCYPVICMTPYCDVLCLEQLDKPFEVYVLDANMFPVKTTSTELTRNIKNNYHYLLGKIRDRQALVWSTEGFAIVEELQQMNIPTKLRTDEPIDLSHYFLFITQDILDQNDLAHLEAAEDYLLWLDAV